MANGVLTAELADFCQSGISVVMASRNSSGRPVIGRGVACRIDAEGRVRVIFREPANVAFQRAIAASAPIAVTFTRPYSHRSIQFKASRAEIVHLSPSDGPAAIRQARAFRVELVSVGYDETLASGYTRFEPHELAAAEFLPESAFVQTPGPSAGSELTP
ncbi:hypothetical protein [Roseovarius arcticus]|uniref:hypothetical protein n=1 Tax=Roseovarius arcticus TaxID=2547404 RepID=UPI001110916C|nr:hypothetical protein [Roseovarius arcticus]